MADGALVKMAEFREREGIGVSFGGMIADSSSNVDEITANSYSFRLGDDRARACSVTGRNSN